MIKIRLLTGSIIEISSVTSSGGSDIAILLRWRRWWMWQRSKRGLLKLSRGWGNRLLLQIATSRSTTRPSLLSALLSGLLLLLLRALIAASASRSALRWSLLLLLLRAVLAHRRSAARSLRATAATSSTARSALFGAAWSGVL